MGKLKKDISSSVYLQFVNKIWKYGKTLLPAVPAL